MKRKTADELALDVAAAETHLIDLLGDCADDVRTAVSTGQWVAVGRHILTVMNGREAQEAFSAVQKLKSLRKQLRVLDVSLSSVSNAAKIRSGALLGKG